MIPTKSLSKVELTKRTPENLTLENMACWTARAARLFTFHILLYDMSHFKWWVSKRITRINIDQLFFRNLEKGISSLCFSFWEEAPKISGLLLSVKVHSSPQVLQALLWNENQEKICETKFMASKAWMLTFCVISRPPFENLQLKQNMSFSSPLE